MDIIDQVDRKGNGWDGFWRRLFDWLVKPEAKNPTVDGDSAESGRQHPASFLRALSNILLVICLLALAGLLFFPQRAEFLLATALAALGLFSLITISRLRRDLSRARLEIEAHRRAEAELENAYDLTLEGWSRVLDLRDQETETHTHRVTELTVQLAKRLDLPPADLVHIRRGALLHDIGKMGVPDGILWKPGPLNDEEWGIMRRHPEYSREMLSSIPYLQNCLDIPYCHHEKWDGSGYPRGLRGEAIPLAARIFTIADVWDALSSTRHYREAWPREVVIKYLRQQAGRHFDPRLVDEFLDMLAEMEE